LLEASVLQLSSEHLSSRGDTDLLSSSKVYYSADKSSKDPTLASLAECKAHTVSTGGRMSIHLSISHQQQCMKQCTTDGWQLCLLMTAVAESHLFCTQGYDREEVLRVIQHNC
jgi:hypothetical protein